MAWPNKDPDDVLDYAIDFGPDLKTATGEALTIVSVEWLIPVGLTEGQSGLVGTHAVVWLSGGTADIGYTCTARATLSGGRTVDRSQRLLVTNR